MKSIVDNLDKDGVIVVLDTAITIFVSAPPLCSFTPEAVSNLKAELETTFHYLKHT